jgi:hypothetical protein
MATLSAGTGPLWKILPSNLAPSVIYQTINWRMIMLKKTYSKTGDYCRVTFKLPVDVAADSAVLCGDFNEWNTEANPMKRLKKGGFSTTVPIPSGKTYRFRYLLDGECWENDWEADAYAPNDFGSDDSILEV